MKMTEFCDHLYDDSTDGYIQILKLDDKNNSDERTIKIYNTKNDGLKDIVEELYKKRRCISSAKYNVYTKKKSRKYKTI